MVKMKSARALFLLLCLHLSRGQQIHFPADSMQNNDDMLPIMQRPPPPPEHDYNKILSRGITKLTLQIANSMSSRNANTDNSVYSPVNIAAILALILLGSNGKTFEEVSNIMGLASGVDIQSKSQLVHEQLGRLLDKIDHSSGDVDELVKIASALFVQDDFPVRSVYRQISENVYKSQVVNLDFQNNPSEAKDAINAWVSDRTNRKIQTILQENPPTNTKVIIVGALYFKGAWEKPFFDGLTRRRPFYPNGRDGGISKKADMMSNGGLFPYYKDAALDCEIMGFPYKGNRTTMYVIMPSQSDRAKVRQLQETMTPADLERLVENTKYHQSVILFPRMRLETSVDLTKSLMDLGVKSLFLQSEANLALLSPGPASQYAPQDFVANAVRNPEAGNVGNDYLIFTRSGVPVPVNCSEVDHATNTSKCERIGRSKKVGKRSYGRKRRQVNIESLDGLRSTLGTGDNPGLYVDQVLHKVYMDITETGTEAAAATSVSLSRGGDIVTFRVDQPFIFFIWNHDTKAILFWGAVYAPTPNYS